MSLHLRTMERLPREAPRALLMETLPTVIEAWASASGTVGVAVVRAAS